MAEQTPVVAAEAAGEATAGKRLVRGLAVAGGEGRLIVAGTPRRQVFRGAAATDLMPRLLPLLDGSRSTEEIRAELGLPRATLARVLSLLDRCGLLEARDAPAAAPEPLGEADLYYSRHHREAGCGSTAELRRRLAVRGVYTVGEADVAARVCEDLAACGVGETRALSTAPGPREAAAVRRLDGALLVAVDSARAPQRFADTVDWGREHGVCVLRAATDGDHVELGPYFFAGHGVCPSCVRRGRAAAGWAETTGPTAERHPAAVDFLAAMVAGEVLSVLSGLPNSSVAQGMVRTALADWDARRYLAAAEPDCPECGGGDAAVPAEAMAAEVYEQSVRRSPRELQPRGWVFPISAARMTELQTERPRFASHPRRPLPGPGREVAGAYGGDPGGQPQEAAEPTGEALVSELLVRVAGFRTGQGDPPGQRWAPSGGNLASVEAYVVRDTGYPDLPGSVFRYDDLAHALIAVRPDRIPAARLLACTDLAGRRFDSVLILVAAHTRCAVKYEGFTHRLVHLDAGCAAAQLGAVAAGYEADVQFAAQWDESIGELLGLNRSAQTVTVVAGLTQPRTTGGVACP